jgi:hypothetical protein
MTMSHSSTLSATQKPHAHAKVFLQKLSAVSTRILKRPVIPVQDRKNLENIGFHRRQIISLPIAPKCLGLALDVRNSYVRGADKPC